MDYPRPKTEEPRRARLWPETIEAIDEFGNKNRDPVLRQENGDPWVKYYKGATSDDRLSRRCATALGNAGVLRPGLHFYTLRHTFATIASGTKDQAAINLVMGHKGPPMEATYREEIANDRLEAVSDYVYSWLYGG
jgi:integrase